ncbi:MAG TPA: hypothetical protein VNQ56_02860 [Pseudolabrys sp.]|nr:hypothetical protein [Pseudolabrys sp.]
MLYLLSLDRTAGFVGWAVVVQVGAFYMQRWHHEMLTEWGDDLRGPRWLAALGRLLGWVAFAGAAYVFYRVGLIPAVVALLAMMATPVAVSTADVWLFRSPARTMALAAAPLTLAAFALMARSAARL